MPGPEPPKKTGCWAELAVTRNGATVFTTGFEDLGVNQSAPLALDLAWSPDSAKVVYRRGSQLRVIGTNGTSVNHDVAAGKSHISSYQWVGDNDLLILTKGADESAAFLGPVYPGYLAKATSVRVLRLNVDSGAIVERFTQTVQSPTFLFRGLGFVMDEISPSSSRIAFSDGANVCIYDDSAQKVIAKQPVDGSVEGVWWSDDNRVILGLNLLSSSTHRFMRFDVPSGAIVDVTDALLPKWNRMYDDAKWFR